MADAIWLVVRDWHAVYYHWGSGDPAAIASAIKFQMSLVDGFRSRTVDTLSPVDKTDF
jgi:hypothetical protein